jgi:cobalt-zinc-cadmium resistance protein CzcA
MKKKRNLTKGLSIMIVLLAFGTNAQVSEQLTLDQCLSLAEKNNAAFKATQLQSEIEILNGKANAGLPKTTANFMYGQYNSFYNKDNNLTVGQTIPFPSALIKERQLGEINGVKAEVASFASWKELKLNIQECYSDICYLNQKRLLLLEQDSLMKALEDRYLIKAELRAATKLDLTMVQSKKKELENVLLRNAQEIKTAENRLALLIGSDHPVTAATDNVDVQIPALSDTTQMDLHPSVLHYKVLGESIQTERSVAVARALPDITLGYVNQTLVGSHSVMGIDKNFGPSSRFSAGQIGLEFPLFFGGVKNQVKSLEVRAEQNTLEGNYAYNELITAYNQELAIYANYLESKALYDENLLPQIEIMHDQSHELLQTGEVSMIEFLQTRQTITEIELNYTELNWQINRSIFRLNWFTETLTR